MSTFWIILLTGFTCLTPTEAKTTEKREAVPLEKIQRSTLGVSGLARADMKVSCYQDKNSGCFFLIRNKRVVEVSEMMCFEDSEKTERGKVYMHLDHFVNGLPVLYKEILLVADVFSKSFSDRKSAEEFIKKLEDQPEMEALFWTRHCLLDLEDDGSR